MIHNPIRKALPDLSNPGAAGDLRSGKQLVGADGAIVTGNLPEVIQATPTISVSSGGLITASATQSGGIVEAGSKGSTQQLTTQGEKTVTPTTTNQTAVASGRYTTGDVVVAGDANLVPENIAEGVSIFGVEGTHSGGGGGDVATLTIDAFNYYMYAYADENGSLVHEEGSSASFALTVPVPQVVVVIATGKSGHFNISGDYQKIYTLSYPDGAVIWMTGDVTATGS